MFTVRQALLEDLTQVRDIGIRTYRAHFGELWRYPHELEAFLAEDFSVSALERTPRDPDVCWLLAYKDDALVGYARVNFDSLLAATQRRGAELQKIYFLPDYAGRGFGRQFFEQVQRRAVERRQPLLWLEVLKQNADAQRFYQRQGLAVCGEAQYTSEQGAIELWAMSKAL
ncbi:GNAT family N-acetyltransferase [Serratia nevei]|uniref:GNAT family N-acetyltransferase n=1 Tax=Serratia nevei TaxID=2703794 RepID=UPI00380C9F78